MVEEGSHACERRLLLALDFNLEGDDSLADSMDVGNVCQGRNQANALSAEYRLSEFHLVHSVVDHHLQVVHLDGLLPKMGEEAECQVAVGNGLAKGTLGLGLLLIDMYPLVVEGGISEKINTFLIYNERVAAANLLTQEGEKVLVGLNDNFAHKYD